MAEVEQHIGTSPLEGDIELLHHYARSQEPAAFLELSRRYAGVVYGTCLRITSNVHDAEELTQDCFFELARQAATIRSSVGGWLHSMATHRALNVVRSRNRRREHEQSAAAIKAPASSEEEVAWRQLEPLLDHAIDDLPEELRTPIILHFLENRSQSEVASRLGVHQSTVSRRIQEALDALRTRLRDSGFVMAVAPLTSLLATHAGQTVAPHLLASLSKIALAGVGSTATGNAIGGMGTALAKLSMWGKALGALASPIFVQLVLGGWFGFLQGIVIVAYLARRQPKWYEELTIAMGGKGYQYEFFPLARWTWTVPPAGWRKAIFQALLGSVMMSVLAVAALCQFAFGWAAMMSLYVAIPLSTAIRIWIRVRACPAESKEQTTDSAEAPPDGISVIQYVCSCLALTLTVASVGLLKMRSPQRIPVLDWGIPIAMSIAMFWAFAETIGKILAYRRCKRTQGAVDPQIASLPDTSRPRATLWALLFFLFLAGDWTWLALWHYRHAPSGTAFLPVDVFQTHGALAIGPPTALVFLAFTIGLFARLRAKLAKFIWWLLAAITVSCATVDLVLTIMWLLPTTIEPQSPEVRRIRTAIMRSDMDVLHDPAAMPELRKALDNPDKEVRTHAARAFEEIGRNAKARDVIPRLRQLLRDDEDAEVRSMAAYALSGMGLAAKTAVPELRKAMRDQDKHVRHMATYAISRIGPEITDAVPELRMALGDENKDVRWDASWALFVMGPAAKEAVPELQKALRDPDGGVRSNAASALCRLGVAIQGAVPEGAIVPATAPVPAIRPEKIIPVKPIRSEANGALKKVEQGGK